MNPTTMNGEVNPARFCAECGAEIIGDAECIDGELTCKRCAWQHRVDELCDEIRDLQAERATTRDEEYTREQDYEHDCRQLEEEFDADMAVIRRQLGVWDRRIASAHKRLEALGPWTPTPFASVDLAPIAGGAPQFEPSEEDWEDFRHWCEEVDRRDEIRSLENHQNPMWGYE